MYAKALTSVYSQAETHVNNYNKGLNQIATWDKRESYINSISDLKRLVNKVPMDLGGIGKYPAIGIQKDYLL